MKLKKGSLVILIFSIIIVLGTVALDIYHLINNDVATFDLILDVLMTIVMISIIFNCFEKKNK